MIHSKKDEPDKTSDKAPDNKSSDQSADFGSVLAEARKAKSFTENEISEHIKIPVNLIIALEQNDIDTLPAATYTQGYIRTYAKFLELPVDDLLQRYNRAVPHIQTAELKSRSSLPGETSSQSPLVKLLTIFLILGGLLVLGYGIFQYYQDKADDIGSEHESHKQRFTGNSLDSPGELPGFRSDIPSSDSAESTDDESSQTITIKQNARMTEDGELVLTDAEVATDTGSTETSSSASAVDEAVTEAETVSDTVKPEPVNTDVVEIYADKGTWLEVYDATERRLFYNMLQDGSSKLLSGQAPFRIKLGNARTTQVSVNNTLVDMSPYIRSNNTVIITVSTDGKDVIFH